MVDAWYHLGVNPYDNLICQTPPFRLRLGIAEYLFKDEELLEESIRPRCMIKQSVATIWSFTRPYASGRPL
ncbi:hypothetical protein [Mucilaginibacter humi]|uniref:hypothetical protein n=1 Tax=Mucilaginibacter humi TaxID=2732510 RepID=UPI001FEBD32B|nr:hypothetical protein [Mucilaginibacter humi]